MSPLCCGSAWSRLVTLRRSVSFYSQLSPFQFLCLCFQFWRQPFHLYCSRFKVQVLCMYISPLVYIHALVYFGSWDLVFCLILTTRFTCMSQCTFTYIMLTMPACTVVWYRLGVSVVLPPLHNYIYICPRMPRYASIVLQALLVNVQQQNIICFNLITFIYLQNTIFLLLNSQS